MMATFGERVHALDGEVVIDMICFTLDSAKQLVEALRGHVQHFLHCGTIWIHGPTVAAPTTEDQPRKPFGEYGVQKAAIEAYLLDEARRKGFPATALHPGHIVGPGWNPLNPAGHFNPVVFSRLARGETVTLPNLGMETVHHVHADDVAQAFMQAIQNWRATVGESFHVVSPQALTLRGYAEMMGHWFGQPPVLEYMGWSSGAPPSATKRPRRRGTTLPTAPTAASPRPNGCWATSPATRRCKGCRGSGVADRARDRAVPQRRRSARASVSRKL